MTVFLLPDEPVFPPAEEAEPDGLIAIGGDLSPARLLNAYAQGIFPWFDDGSDIFWYSPDPRMILFPDRFKAPKSLIRTVQKNIFEIRFDTSFYEVIRACADTARPDQEGTWISNRFIEAYSTLYDMGIGHSVEVFLNDSLAGGLYGISLGEVFFGESMFHTVNDASKVAFYALVERSKQWRIRLIDCQISTKHLANLGATEVPRAEYLLLLKESLNRPTLNGRW